MKQNTPNYAAHKFVDQLKPFQGSNLRGTVYRKGYAESSAGSWLNAYERERYEAARDRIEYVVWSWYTPIAYWTEEGGWYRVGQTFSSYTARHRYGALRNVRGHSMQMTGTRGDWTVDCLDCGTSRYFTRKRDADEVRWTH